MILHSEIGWIDEGEMIETRGRGVKAENSGQWAVKRSAFLLPTIHCPLPTHLLLPASAQSLIKLDQSEQFVASRLSQAQLGGEQIAVGVQRVELSVNAALIPQISQARAVLQGGHKLFLLDANLLDLAVLDERVGDLAERVFDGLLILGQGQ